jgi:hypothetical protein
LYEVVLAKRPNPKEFALLRAIVEALVQRRLAQIITIEAERS